MWLDVFQKIRALGYNGVSFYVHWALLEGKPGDFSADGIFALEPFFDAASKAGIYLLARPGPYINAEASGGGFPGWLQRVKCMLRTDAEDYLHATDKYAPNIFIISLHILIRAPAMFSMSERSLRRRKSRMAVPSFSYSQRMNTQEPLIPSSLTPIT